MFLLLPCQYILIKKSLIPPRISGRVLLFSSGLCIVFIPKMMMRKCHFSIISHQNHEITISQLKNKAYNINFVWKHNNFAPTATWKWKNAQRYVHSNCTRPRKKKLFFTIYTFILWDKFETLEDKSIITCILVLIIV